MQHEKRKLNSEKGVAMLEFTLIAPLMVLLMIATYDLGNALNQYLSLSRIVYEGTRYAATLPGLEVTGANTTEYVAANADTMNHNKVRERVRNLLIKSGFNVSAATIRTENQNNEWVKITVSEDYNSIFGLFRTLPISVSASGPFLSLQPDPE